MNYDDVAYYSYGMFGWRRMKEGEKVILNLSCLIQLLRDEGSKLTPKVNFKFPPI